MFVEKNWLKTKHSKQYNRKVWHNISTEKGGYIVARMLIDYHTADRGCFSFLINKSNAFQVTAMLADGDHDSRDIYQILERQNLNAFIPPPSRVIIYHEIDSLKRYKAVKYIKEKGYWAWYYKNNFGRTNKVENTFYCLKTILERKLNPRILSNQNTESHLLCCMHNKITKIAMPKFVKAC